MGNGRVETKNTTVTNYTDIKSIFSLKVIKYTGLYCNSPYREVCILEVQLQFKVKYIV